ncbi:MAG TPA: DUF1653 domain-containing protein [Candidatus Dojkabacteria bacterium]|jgi:hypothetical protein|nr:DUF1653 domain-containing protein [Candidatus Dojkabacteria bacterium]HOF78892.1 DUF1653 domain-containing protein [Candidatus Dojkabacteria bacterium]HOR05857.1 DUF1653 domain-containing protein [Candidatus Dojkabacteria bacterium]HOT60780.1 DUF1653 domain-containing protein [Candidatus Dojkabacteria bacterium]HQI92553.1 DUF1653 domain-containing protein [Candidatus Dojkabacteria bacterium]
MSEKESIGEREIMIGGVYKHFKGDYYQVLTVGKDSETEKDMVVYTSLYYKEDKGTRVWIRSLEDFMGTKELEDGTIVNRFEFVSER